MNLTHLLPFIQNKNRNTGATLAELLLGSALTSVVIGVAGFGLVNILSLEQKASAKGTIQLNANRALDFISEEVKLSRKIESDAVAALAEAPDFTLPDGAKPILVLQLPNIAPPVIYYLKPAEDIWNGPNVIVRWGPSLDEEGQYETANINNPENWESHVLIDSINNLDITPDCPPDFQPTHTNATEGFNACVDSKEKLVQLHLATTVDNKTWHKAINYKVKTMAFARSDINQGFSDDNEPVFVIDDNKLTLEKAGNVRFELLGGEITCGAGGEDIPVSTHLYIDETEYNWDTNSPLTLPNQPAGTTFDVESISGDGSTCSGTGMTVSTDDINTQQVMILLDGDSVPDIQPFANQSTIDVFLRKYVANGKIKLAENEAIYLFELGTTDKEDDAFDLQDNVVLATVDSAN
ncbi:MAG: hypothetical protein AB4063_15530 [Crocosphaera sp.]